MNTTNCSYQILLKHLAKLNDTQEIDEVLSALLTQKERQDIANRIRIFDLLEKGTPQRTISQQLGVGIATVSRGAKALSQQNNAAITGLLHTYRNNDD